MFVDDGARASRKLRKHKDMGHSMLELVAGDKCGHFEPGAGNHVPVGASQRSHYAYE